MNPASLLLRGLVRAYQLVLSPLLPRHACRFLPSCSSYALDALETHGALKGVRLAGLRILRCHPWGGAGYDPVPPATHSVGRADDSTRKPCCSSPS